MTEQRVVALTGATGFIGSSLLSQLRQANYKLRILVRSPEKLPAHLTNTEVIIGDLHDLTALEQLLQGSQYLVHCAGRVKGSRLEQFENDNVAGTQNIADIASQNSSIKQCLYISSLSAREPNISYYAASKFKSEQLLKSNPYNQWTIIRPAAVYGPKDTEVKPLIDWMRHGLLWVPGNKENRFSLLHVHDLSQLVINLIAAEYSQSEILEPDDGKSNGYNWLDIRNIASAYFERNIFLLPIPKTILKGVAEMNVLFSKTLKYAPMLTPEKIQELTHRNWVVDQKETIPHWSPKIDFKAGLSTLYSKK